MLTTRFAALVAVVSHIGVHAGTGGITVCPPFALSLLLSSLELIGTKVYEPSKRALLGSASHLCKSAPTAVERIWQTLDSHGQIMALVFR